MDRPKTAPRPHAFLLGFLGLILFNSLFLAVSNRLPGPPRQPLTAFFYMGNVMLHLLLGLAAFLVLFRIRPAWHRAVQQTPNRLGWLGVVCGLSLVVSLWAGLGLLVFGNLRPMAPVLAVHGWSALVASVSGALWLGARVRAALEASRPARTAVALISVAVLPGLFLLWAASRMAYAEGRIVNGNLAPASMDGEGDGPKGKFWPSSVQAVDSKFFRQSTSQTTSRAGRRGAIPTSTSSGTPRRTTSAPSITSGTASPSSTCRRSWARVPPSGAAAATTWPSSSRRCPVPASPASSTP